MKANNRIDLLDLIKGFAIFLVVFGHSIQYGSGSDYQLNGGFFLNPVFSFIYSFHMPLFMLVSGFLFYKYRNESISEVFISKSKSLLIPILFWQLIYLLFALIINDYTPLLFLKKYIASVITGLWFLWAVFYSSLLISIINNVIKSNKNKKIAYFIIFILTFITPDFLNLSLYKYMLPYFIIGYYCQNTITFIKNINLWTYILITTISTSVFLFLLHYFNYDSYIYTSGYSIFTGSIDAIKHIKIDIYRFIIGLFGSVVMILIINLIDNNKSRLLLRTKKAIKYIGVNSLGIYIISGYTMSILSYLNLNSLKYGYSLIASLIIIILSVVIIQVIKTNVWAKYLLLGIYKKK